MNTTTPRVFIAATRQNDGKTTASLGLIAALQEHFPRIGYIKPVGQRFVEIEEQKIDEDTVLMDAVYRLNCPLVDMSPIAVEPAFTRKYLESANNEALVKRIQEAFDRVAWEKDFVLCEGSGHAGVGSVFDLSNAQVAKTLGCKVIIVTQGGIGRPIDEVCLNQALFEKEGVEIIGVIVNKVLEEKIPEITRFVGRGLKRKGPGPARRPAASANSVQPDGGFDPRGTARGIAEPAADVAHAGGRRGGRRDGRAKRDAVFQARRRCSSRPATAKTSCSPPARPLLRNSDDQMAGIVLTGGMRPGASVLKALQTMPVPVLLAKADSYQVASRVHNLTVKTRPGDAEKISLIRDIVAKSVNVKKIVQSL